MSGKDAEKQAYLPEQKLLERIFTDSSRPLEQLERQFCVQEGMDGFQYGAVGLYGQTWDCGEREALFEAFYEVVYYIPLPELTLVLLRSDGDCRGTAGRISLWLQNSGRPRNLAYLTRSFRLSEARQVRAMFETITAEMFFRDGPVCAPLESVFPARKAAGLYGEDTHRLRQLQQEIAACLVRGEAERVREKLEEFFEAGARGGPAAFREQCARLYFRIDEALESPDAKQRIRCEKLSGPGKSLYQLIGEANSAAEAAGHITSYINGLLARYQPLWKDPSCRVAAYVEEYIEKHYMEAISIADVAAGVGFSVNYMRSIFKRSRGMTIQNYLVEYRLKAACDLLRNTSNTVSKVGQMVGYSNTSYFCAAFLKRYGKTPSEWRRE